MSNASRETTALSTVPVGEKVAMPHGGALRNGGTNKGGPGRLPDKERKALRELSRRGMRKVLKPLIDGEKITVLTREGHVIEIPPSAEYRLQAVEMTLKYGIGTADKVDVQNEYHGEVIHTHQRRDIELPALGSED